MRFEKRQTFFKKMFAVFRFPFRGTIGPACLPVRPVAEWLRGFSFTKRKGTIGNGPKVINRRRVINSLIEEKGRGKEKCPLDPLKRKGEGKRTRPGFLRNQLFQDRARAREAKASVRVFFFRGGRGGGGDRRQLLSAEREGLRSLGVVLPPLRPQPHRRKGVLLRLLQTTGRGARRRDRVSGELVHDATSCAMCKRMIINAGIEKVIVRNDENEFTTIDVKKDWVENDDSLGDKLGY